MVIYFLVGVLFFSSTLVGAYNNISPNDELLIQNQHQEPQSTGEYGIQWQMDYGTDPRSGARYEGPQPIGDSDNDGKNELLISGRDCAVRVMEWDETQQTYLEKRVLRPPLYPYIQCDAGGMAIGDLTGNGKNEVAVTWYSTIYRYFLGRYWIIGLNPWIFKNEGGSADCLIGDCDNDGKNELIMSGGPLSYNSTVPPIVILKWKGWRLVKVAEWDDPDAHDYKYVYMAGIGDVDEDGKNEIVCACAGRVHVLNWNENTQSFDSTVVLDNPSPQNWPFSCVCKDCDNDGEAEILIGYYSPHITILNWNGTGFETQFDIYWPDGEPVIEGIDVGDTDNDGIPEVCAGAGVTHVLQWNGTTYVEEAVLPTWGWMAVVSIGDCDNDGLNEINAGNVDIDHDEVYMEWVFKYNWVPSNKIS